MDTTLQKIHKITSYNVVAGNQIIAGADCYTDSEDEKSFVLEVMPFETESKNAGFILLDEKQWDDFFDSDETEETVSPEDILDRLLSTVFAGYAEQKQQVEIKKRKDVFDLVFTKNNRTLSLAMVYEYDRFVNSDPNFKPALFIHDMEEFDTWQFPLDATDEHIFRTVYPALKSQRTGR